VSAAPSGQPLVEIENVDFAYGPRSVFRGLTLSIPRGRLVAVLGASGSGKSTLLRLIGAQLMPSKGTIRVEGKAVHQLGTSELYALRRRMGLMFQAGGLFSDMNVFDNVAFPIREHTRLPESMVREMVLMKLHAVGLRGARNLEIGELSGGMTRRVALARAIAIDPMLTMYDEPFAGLDPISISVIAELIRVLNDALGITSVVVSYDVSEALKVADYVYVLGDGRVAGEGTPAAMQASKDPFLRQFFDAQADGPISFDYPTSRTYGADLGL
jgi:phospholipid/cholesterol/gamma-HCH transport system ATP-binding protein